MAMMQPANRRKLIVMAGLVSLQMFAGCSDSSSDSGNNATSNSLADNSAEVKPTTIKDLFKNTADFDKKDIEAGSTNCTDITDNQEIAGLMVAWPDDLKSFLTEVLSTFPAQQLITASVHGIYLVPDSVLTDPASKISTAGLACDRGSDYKGMIFLNYNSVVQKRSIKGIQVWQPTMSVSNNAINVSEGDAAAVTLIHELFHAIDNKLFQHGSLEAFGRRQAFKNLSWLDEKPRATRGQILSLAATAIEGNSPARRCNHSHKSEVALTTGTSIKPTADEVKSLAAELKNLADNSNFIVPYTLASPSEDFAETLTVYYFGAYLNNWQKRDVRLEGQSVYLHDTGSILQTKQQHKAKVCAAAKLVFGSCKL